MRKPINIIEIEDKKSKLEWSKYNNSEVDRKNKQQCYKKWTNDLGVKDWDDWAKSKPPENNLTCNACQIPECLSQVVFGKKLVTHYKDYNKNNSSSENVISLCVDCKSKANKNKEYWKIVYGVKSPKVAIVVPTVRSSAIKAFLSVWEKEFKNTTIIVIEDNPKKTLDIAGENILHFCGEDIEKDLGKDSWIIPRKTSAICSYGFYKAYELGFDVTIKLDDDVLLRSEKFVESHIKNLFAFRSLTWANVFRGNKIYPRGFPYRERTYSTVLNYGLADNILDMDAATQIIRAEPKLENIESVAIGKGTYLPLCGMNVAFLTEITPAYYFTLQGPFWGLDRFDDIWAGIFLKKITDHLNQVIAVGEPVVTHSRLSNPLVNLEKEAGGLDINECLWQEVDRIKLTKTNYKDCYLELANKLEIPVFGYGEQIKKAMTIWANLFQ